MATANTSLLITPIGKLSFPHLFVPQPRLNNPEPVYQASLIIPPEGQKTAEYAALKNAALEACKSQFGDRMNDPSFVSRLRSPFRDAGEKSNLAGYEAGHIFLNCWSKYPPGVVGPQRQQMLKEDVFAGQFARFSVNVYAYDRLGNVGVAFGLNNVQVTKMSGPEIKRLDSRRSAEDSFGDLPVEDGPGSSAPIASPNSTNPF
jgi:hypothetical protein